MKLSSRDHKHTFCLISTSTGSKHTQAKPILLTSVEKLHVVKQNPITIYQTTS